MYLLSECPFITECPCIYWLYQSLSMWIILCDKSSELFFLINIVNHCLCELFCLWINTKVWYRCMNRSPLIFVGSEVETSDSVCFWNPLWCIYLGLTVEYLHFSVSIILLPIVQLIPKYFTKKYIFRCIDLSFLFGSFSYCDTFKSSIQYAIYDTNEMNFTNGDEFESNKFSVDQCYYIMQHQELNHSDQCEVKIQVFSWNRCGIKV